MYHTKFVNRAYTLNSTLDSYLLFENFTTYNYKISYVYIIIIVYFSSLHNCVMFNDLQMGSTTFKEYLYPKSVFDLWQEHIQEVHINMYTFQCSNGHTI